MLDALKPMLTNLRLEVEGKGENQRMFDNLANWAFCTNYMDAVLKNRNDRRYSVFFTAQQSYDDIQHCGMGGQYFPDFYAWLRHGGGYASVAYFLKHYPIPSHLDPSGNCHRAPETSSTSEAIKRSQGGIEAEIEEAAENNTVGFRGGWVSSWAMEKLLKNRGVRIGRNKYHDILSDLGYERCGRAGRVIFQEEAQRPVLYKKPGVTGDYERAQGYPVGG
jgi:hypothetical protein